MRLELRPRDTLSKASGGMRCAVLGCPARFAHGRAAKRHLVAQHAGLAALATPATAGLGYLDFVDALRGWVSYAVVFLLLCLCWAEWWCWWARRRVCTSGRWLTPIL